MYAEGKGAHIAVYTCVTSWLPVSKQPIRLHVSPCKNESETSLQQAACAALLHTSRLHFTSTAIRLNISPVATLPGSKD